MGCVDSVKRQSTGAKIDNMQASIDAFILKMKTRDKKHNKRMKALLAENSRLFDELMDSISKRTEAITEQTVAVAGSGGAAADALKDDRRQGSETERDVG